jgi:hypothetical protein
MPTYVGDQSAETEKEAYTLFFGSIITKISANGDWENCGEIKLT